MWHRRPLILAPLLLLPAVVSRAATAVAAPASAGDEPNAIAEQALRSGSAPVVVLRHAIAPGTFDPAHFDLNDCRTQRNLDARGQAQARRIGHWFRERGLQPARVRSSPWCRCLDTARLAFGHAEIWPALGSPHGRPAAERLQALTELQQALRQLSAALPDGAKPPPAFEVWMTHQFVISALLNRATQSGEGVVLGTTADGLPKLIAPFQPA